MATYVNDTKPTSSFTSDTKPSNTQVIGGGVPIGLLLTLTHVGGASTSIYSNDSKPS